MLSTPVPSGKHCLGLFVLSRLALITPTPFSLLIWALSFSYITVLFGCLAVEAVHVCVNISWHHEWLHDFLQSSNRPPMFTQYV
jgi:acyl-CoA synthetase (AMP-forming)/AMP-acid ligase II